MEWNISEIYLKKYKLDGLNTISCISTNEDKLKINSCVIDNNKLQNNIEYNQYFNSNDLFKNKNNNRVYINYKSIAYKLNMTPSLLTDLGLDVVAADRAHRDIANAKKSIHEDVNNIEELKKGDVVLSKRITNEAEEYKIGNFSSHYSTGIINFLLLLFIYFHNIVQTFLTIIYIIEYNCINITILKV